MNKLWTLRGALIGAALFASTAAIAASDPNPYHPSPIAVSETPDHGAGTYCSKPLPGGVCDQVLSAFGGPGSGYADLTSAEKQAFGAATRAALAAGKPAPSLSMSRSNMKY